jgi:hypothetical protein
MAGWEEGEPNWAETKLFPRGSLRMRVKGKVRPGAGGQMRKRDQIVRV